MPATKTKKTAASKKKATTVKKSTAVKKTTTAPKKKAVAVKKVKAVAVTKDKQAIKSLRMAPNEKHAFMLISTDFDGEKHKLLQVLSTIILLTILGIMVYLTVLANEIANMLLTYGWPA